MGGIFGGGGGGGTGGSSIAGIGSGVMSTGGKMYAGFQSAKAANKAGKIQVKLLNEMEKNVTENMDPALVNQLAYEADVKRAQNRLALQEQVDPAMAALRKSGETYAAANLEALQKAPSSGLAEKVAQQTTDEALTRAQYDPAFKALLMNAATENMQLGATLPADVQAELMQAGLEGAGSVTGSATGRGVGGTILRSYLGQAALALQAQRRQEAMQLATTANTLEAQTQQMEALRQQYLQNLFPRLKEQQLQTQQLDLNKMKAALSGYQTANQSLPEAGLSGQNVANLWLARVGAQNQITGQKAGVRAQQELGIAAGRGAAIGALLGFGQTEGMQGVINPSPQQASITPSYANLIQNQTWSTGPYQVSSEQAQDPWAMAQTY